MNDLASLWQLLKKTGIPYVVIGAHAINAWITPRFTADVDITVQAGPHEIGKLKQTLSDVGYLLDLEHGADQPSGPDFIRFSSKDSSVVLEVQIAKTAFQQQVIERAVMNETGLAVATPEDLIVMKLIANRPKDKIDLIGLIQLKGLDWAYVEQRASEWDVMERLSAIKKL